MNLNLLLVILPFFMIAFGYTVYKFQGKKQFISMDAVQFLYTFLVAPMIFVWFKLMLFVLLRNELGVSLTPNQWFFYDTVFSVLFLFMYAFVSMHSLTKSFRLRKDNDPFYDLFYHSEYIHLWLSHHAMLYFGMAFFSLFAFLNLFFPLELTLESWQFYLVLVLGVVLGPAVYVGILMADPRQATRKFMRFVKLAIASFAILHMILYALFDPSLSPDYIIYWFFACFFVSLAICASLTFKSKRAVSVFEQAADVFRHYKWGINMELGGHKKK